MRQTFKKLSPEFFLVALIVLYGIYGSFSAATGIELPMRPFVLIATILILIFSTYFGSYPTQIRSIIAAAFVGNELIMFVLPFILLPRIIFFFNRSGSKGRIKKSLFPFLVFFLLLLLQLVVSSVRELSGYTVLFWFLFFGFGFLFFIYYAEKSYRLDDLEGIVNFFRQIIVIQMFILVVQSVFHRDFSPGDMWNGSFLDADKTGIYLALLFLSYIVPPLFIRGVSLRRILGIRRIVGIIVVGIFIILADAKIKVFLLIGGVIFFAFFFFFLKGIQRLRVLSQPKMLLVCIVFVISSAFMVTAVNLYLKYISESEGTIASTLGQYTSSPSPELVRYGVNSKYVIYHNVYVDLLRENPWKWFWGEGPGKFDSRTSNMLAYDLLYKDPQQFKLPSFIPPYSSPLAKRYMTGVWTEENASFTTFISANLSFPFAGWVSVKGETGIPGMLLFLFICFTTSYFLVKKANDFPDMNLKSWAVVIAIFWVALPLMMIVDNIQEMPQIMYPMYLLSAAFLGTPVQNSHVPVSTI